MRNRRKVQRTPRTANEQGTVDLLHSELRVLAHAVLIVQNDLRRGGPLEGSASDLHRIAGRVEGAADALEEAMLADELASRGRE